MEPVIHPNMLAVLVAVVASFALGGIWYGPLFGKTWRKELGFADGEKPTGKEVGRAFAINLIGGFLMAYVMAHEVAIWRPSTWNAGADAAAYTYGFYAGFFIWLGFIVPMLLNGVAFERKSWKVFGIGAGYQFLSLQAIAMILSAWR